MKDKGHKSKHQSPQEGNDENNNLKGYPIYPPSEDIYSKYQEERDIDPEDITKTKEVNEKAGAKNEKDFIDDVTGSDLDVPGSELDDEQENIGIEDEENNYYSLGGDEHTDLDENKE